MSFWETISEIARTLLIMSVTGGVVALLLFTLKPIIKNRIPKSNQYYLWIIVLVAFLVPFSNFVSLPFATPMVPLQEVLDENVKTTVERREELAQEQYGKEYGALDAQEQIDISFRKIGLTNGHFNDYVLFALITIGGVSFLMDMVQYAVYTAKLRRKRLDAKSKEVALLHNLCKNKKCPRLYRSSLAATPMLLGVFRPVIYMPDREYSEQQIQNIMLHELTHLRRHDVIVKWVAAIAVYVHWFNPIAYFVRREIDRTCELACDEAVIYGLDSEGKQIYGDTLIDIAANSKKPKMIVSTTMCEEKKALKDRLSAIMKSKKNTKTIILFSCALLLVTLGIIVILGSSANRGNSVDALFREFENEAAVIRPQSIITEVGAGDYGTVIFYYNANNNLACAVVEHGLFGNTVSKSSAELTVEYSTPASIMAGQYNNTDNWLVWGVLRDMEITRPVIYGQDADIVEADDLRLFYIIGDGRMPDDDEFLLYNDAGELVWEISTEAPEYPRDELLSVMRENVPPEGLTLEITSVAKDDAEFLLTNMTESIVEYGYVNSVERYVDGVWEPAISETKEIFPENPMPLQPGEQMYGMTAWVRDDTELTPGTYRYLLLVHVREGDLPAYPVVLEASFEITG